MSSFQFPANPSDGDIVVRGNLQAFYNAATNTWRVSEVPTAPGIPGPPGPPGPIGPPGQGVGISGAVATEADLPAPNAAQFQFWIVDDVNEIFWSDGLTWTNLGGPIQGPQGEEGEKGEDGTNGQNGRGWYDTSVDESNGEYKVTFLSNDGLTFTTDNLKGPAGNDGSDGNDGADFNGNFPIATTTSTGVVQIGTGLDIDTAGVLSVDLLDADLDDTGSTPLSLAYSPITFTLGTSKDEQWEGSRHDVDYTTGSQAIKMPDNATEALVYMFSSSQMYGASSFPGTTNSIYAFRAYIANQLSLTNATYEYGSTDIMSFANQHNLTIGFDSNSIVNRSSITPVTKINKIKFSAGADVTFNYTCRLYRTGWCRLIAGQTRIVVVPIKSGSAGGGGTGPNPFTEPSDGIINIDNTYYFREDQRDLFDDLFPPATPEEEAADAATAFKEQVIAATTEINNALPYVDAATATRLTELRDELYASRNVSGDYETVYYYIQPRIAEVNTLLDYSFPFEP